MGHKASDNNSRIWEEGKKYLTIVPKSDGDLSFEIKTRWE